MHANGSLQLENLSRSFGQTGVKGLDLEIPPGQGFSLLGPSGCGKTTTLRLIGGFERPDSGRLLHGGADITGLPPQKRDIRTVFQRYALFPHLTVSENIAFGLRMQKREESALQKKVEWGLDLLEIGPLRSRSVQQLSGGEQQRVALARALVTEPSVLLLDEPLAALDLKLRERMQLELLSLRKKLGTTFIFVTHDQGEAMMLSDRIAVMRAGKIEQVGTPEEVYKRPRSRFVAEFVGQANFFDQGGQWWMARPEQCRAHSLSWTASADSLALKVLVTEAAFLGGHHLLKCRGSGGSTYLLKAPGHENPPAKVGTEIQLACERKDLWTVGAS
ncbi:MAG TPA: ABC transporter ATP-binding protein [Bdellovibrionota bacterium]|jgi:ABC-type Fe3+/spermidine/putrescine transport system ATPase subunit